MKKLQWKSKSFSGEYMILDKELQVGSLKNSFLSSKTNGVLNDTKVVFKSKGILKQYIEIIKAGTDDVIGVITFGSFMSKAKIIINGTSYNWKYTNSWNTKWRVSIENGVDINYNKKNTKGTIESNIDDSLLMLIGLYINIYYIQTMAVVLFIIFLPTWISLFNIWG